MLRILKSESGQATILMSLFMGLVMLGFLAFALDVGYLFHEKRVAQAAADAAAVAAAEEVTAGNSVTSTLVVNAANVASKLNGFDTTLATNPATVTRYGALHGANCIASYTGASCVATPAQIGTYVTSTGLPNLGGGTVTVDTVRAHMFPDGDQVSPHRVQVKVTYVFPYKIPFVTSSNLTMSSTSVMTIIQ